jgi:hypothetical protein
VLGIVFFFLWSALVTCVEAQEVTVNGISLENVHSALKITIDIIEFRQGDEPVVHLTTGRRHYELSLLSPGPIPLFDAELPLSRPFPTLFTVAVEDGREFRGCLIKGLSSSASAEASGAHVYTFACEDVGEPPVPCAMCN